MYNSYGIGSRASLSIEFTELHEQSKKSRESFTELETIRFIDPRRPRVLKVLARNLESSD